MSLVAINWKPNPRELRKFGVTMIIGCTLFGLAFQFALGKVNVALAWYVLGIVAGTLGLTGTRAALPVYWAWMAVAFVVGNITSRVVLALVFYVVVTPIGLVRRCFGSDDLRLRKSRESSFWHDVVRQTDRARYERQY